MAKAPDPKLLKILEDYGETPREAMWDCHGTWVIYHRAIERIAARAKINFEMPEIVEARSADKIVAIIARGFMGDRSEWSFGEAAPGNNKNSYPYAMAEKRAKDRVVLKLVGLHGLAYSEEESDDFRPNSPDNEKSLNLPAAKSSASLKREDAWGEFQRDLEDIHTLLGLQKCKDVWREKVVKDGWSKTWIAAMPDEFAAIERRLMNAVEADDVFPGDRPSRHQNILAAG